jgi:hypothetical protein
VIGQTAKGETVIISKALYRWLMVDLLKRIGGVSSPGVGDIANDAATALAAANQATLDIAALDMRLDSAEASITGLDARVDALELALAELNMEYATRLDNDASPPTVSYFGTAETGSAEGSAVWRIKKIVYGAVDGDVTVTWADGNANFDNVWTNRAALSYS